MAEHGGEDAATGMPTPCEHCLLPGRRFSYVPEKHRGDLTLPFMVPRRCASEGTLTGNGDGSLQRWRSSRGYRRGAATAKDAAARLATVASGTTAPSRPAKCYGAFCDAEIQYPATLLDLESSSDPWMAQAHELCGRSAKGPHGSRYRLFSRDEMVACLQDAQTNPSAQSGSIQPPSVHRGAPGRAPGRICISWIVEARHHPSLCQWLESTVGWMLDLKDVDLVVEAAKRIHEDDHEREQEQLASGNKASAVVAGLRHSLQAVPVCGTCLCIYTLIHTVVNMVRVKRRDLWATREQQRRREEDGREKEVEKERLLETMLSHRRKREGELWSIAPSELCRSSLQQRLKSTKSRRSLFLDPDVEVWLYSSALNESPTNGSGGSVRVACKPLSRRSSRATSSKRS